MLITYLLTTTILQAIKQKLQFKRNIGSCDESSSPHEEDKARILFGTRHVSLLVNYLFELFYVE